MIEITYLDAVRTKELNLMKTLIIPVACLIGVADYTCSIDLQSRSLDYHGTRRYLLYQESSYYYNLKKEVMAKQQMQHSNKKQGQFGLGRLLDNLVVMS